LVEAIRIGEPPIEVAVRRHAGARRLVLRVSSAGRGPVLTLPPGVGLTQARSFLAGQEAWLRRHLAAHPSATRVGEGSVLPFGDGTLTLCGHPGRAILRRGDQLLLPGAPGHFGPRAAAWLREEARQAIVDGVAAQASQLGRPVGRIRLADPRARWGSCTSGGDLMFSWRLAMAPRPVLDYVVAHEVAHLVELSHSARFWEVVGQLCPGYEAPRYWLRQHGAGLHRHDFTAAA